MIRILFLLISGILFLQPDLSLGSEPHPIPEIPKEDVGFPLPYYSPVTGTFAEIRNHNLHLGSDFKSYGLNGHSILATFDGYVDEISYSKLGYGLSLNFYSPKYKIKSKYAHLHSFGGGFSDLENLRIALLMMGEKEGFQIKLPQGLFQSKKGNPIGKTGESGSGISHLHLEFRTEKGIINPLFFPDLHQKDNTPPTISSLFIEGGGLPKPLILEAKESEKGIYFLFDEMGNQIKELSLTGKVKVRLSGYDIIRSRNKNNVYGMDLFLNGKEIFRRDFSYLSFEDGAKKHQFYDINRSSLSPPVYFYHMYEQPKDWKEEGFSFDLDKEPSSVGQILEAGLRDASSNRSYIKIIIKNESPNGFIVSGTSGFGKKVSSSDKHFSFDVSKNESTGNGKIEIEDKKDATDLPFSIPKGLILKSKIYKIESVNFTWKGDGQGELILPVSPTNKDSLFFWDSSIKKFSSVAGKRKANGFSFSLSKLGYLMVLEDMSPPSITPMTSLARHIELPEIRSGCFENRYYALNDVGTGFKTTVNLLLDGQTYPYEYDPDRKAIKVTLPKSLYKEKPYLLLEVRAFDFAENISQPFTDLIVTSGWKNDVYASCPESE
ncbi:M23 family metallopeptidase [Leptospira ilyithenensis]|uniref:M23 family metallopeptidase n=1 Tax=Leptospira ilyithenensis TaxID=2484901 RepID=A0A4R9LQC5_9LEPT|nr:M23 family metallopeptidase [Leptospira ilyithenensis]TGN11701.1 M23 family metallopeptidase [Leptospira ilyithenensis]